MAAWALTVVLLSGLLLILRPAAQARDLGTRTDVLTSQIAAARATLLRTTAQLNSVQAKLGPVLSKDKGLQASIGKNAKQLAQLTATIEKLKARKAAAAAAAAAAQSFTSASSGTNVVRPVPPPPKPCIDVIDPATGQHREWCPFG